MNALKALLLVAAFAVTACEDEVAAIPVAVEPTRQDIGYYCNMIVIDHTGPKGQIHLKGRDEPIWFSSVRDTIAFTLLPEESKEIAAIYVNDMGRASDWASPEPGNWVDAKAAWYVIGSDKRGGMGAPEAVPFSEHKVAASFAGAHGGEVFALEEILTTAILGAVESPPTEMSGTHGDHGETDAHAETADGHTMSHMPSSETIDAGAD